MVSPDWFNSRRSGADARREGIEIMDLLHKLAVEQNKAILLSTHNVEQALVLADKLWLLSKESGLQCGVTEDLILNHPSDSSAV